MLRSTRASIASALFDVADPAEGGEDLDVRWMGALMFVIGAALTGLLVVLVPPTADGDWGWAVAALVIGFRLGAAVWLLVGRGPVSYRPVYVASVLGIIGLCFLQFLASAEAFYHDLVLFDLLFVAAVQPARRTLVALLIAVAGMIPALVRSGQPTVSVAEWGAEAILWTLVTGLVLLYTSSTRRKRAELHRRGSQAQALARVDALTRLGNRRAFDEILDHEFGQARRYGTALSVILGDLDGFKAVNDRHGHPAGDDLLRQVAARLLETVRRPDVCFRWGGDEFAVVLPHTGLSEAGVVGGRIRDVVAERVTTPGDEPVRMSLGVVELDAEQEPADLLAAADAALLEAKAELPRAPRRGWRFGRQDASGGVRRNEALP